MTEAWSAYCTATFTQDYQAIDAFDEPLFTAHTGEEYLMGSYDSDFGEAATLYYLTSHGPYDFEVVASESGEFPFVSNCEIDAALQYYAAFDDVEVFQAADLAVKLCDLSAGSALPRKRSGTWRIVRMFGVTSSPTSPSPRVEASASTPTS